MQKEIVSLGIRGRRLILCAKRHAPRTVDIVGPNSIVLATSQNAGYSNSRSAGLPQDVSNESGLVVLIVHLQSGHMPSGKIHWMKNVQPFVDITF